MDSDYPLKMRISVLMAIYNCADTLPEAIDSLLSQTYTGFKLILCDDGSTDDTYLVAQSYANKYSNILLLKNKANLKLAASLNRCLEYADTEYIARMDGDDISLPERLEKELTFLDAHPEYALVSCPMIYFDETGDWGQGKVNPMPNKYDFRKGTPHAHAPCMIRTSVIKSVGGYTDNKWTIRVEDFYLWYKIYKNGFKGYNLQEVLYKMRDDQNAIARRKAKDRLRTLMLYCKITAGLGIFPSLFKIAGLLVKAFLPASIMTKIRKHKLNINK